MHQSVSVPTTVSPSPGGSSAVLQSWFGNNVAGMWLCVGDACGVWRFQLDLRNNMVELGHSELDSAVTLVSCLNCLYHLNWNFLGN